MNGQPRRGVELRIMEYMMPEIRAEQVAVMQQIDAKSRAGEQIDVFMIGHVHLGKINKQAAARTQSKDIIHREIKDTLLKRMMRYHEEIHQQITSKNSAKAQTNHFAGLVLEECMTVQPEIRTQGIQIEKHQQRRQPHIEMRQFRPDVVQRGDQKPHCRCQHQPQAVHTSFQPLQARIQERNEDVQQQIRIREPVRLPQRQDRMDDVGEIDGIQMLINGKRQDQQAVEPDLTDQLPQFLQLK